jgi:serine/threonine protein phosphatase 1
LYAIGDIHGRADLLDLLLDLIDTDDTNRGPARTTLIFLGDLIDRGPDSADVVQRLLLLAKTDTEARFLLGNHEEVFLSAVAGDLGAVKFLHRIGGDTTITSYGMKEADYLNANFDDLMEFLQRAVPPSHIEFLNSFEDQINIGDYSFVHAGVRPGVALADQKPEDLRWIRGEFLGAGEPFEKMVVHGHTISPDVDERSNRIGLDTGAYLTGRLTAMGFEGTERWVLQTNPAEPKPA